MKQLDLRLLILIVFQLFVSSIKSQTYDERINEIMNSVLRNDKQQSPRDLAEKAKNGDMDAMFELGVCYRKGNRGVEGDQSKAALLFKKAADNGHAQAQYYIASYYENGLGGLPIDSVAAYRYYTLAAKQGDPYSMIQLGEYYITYKGVNNAKEECLQWLERISEGKYVRNEDEEFRSVSDAEYILYYLYQGNEGIAPNTSLSMSYLLKAVNHGDDSTPEAWNELGECYLNGKGVGKNKQKAIEWFKKAADLNCGLAQGNLGIIYYNEGKYDEAFPLLRKAAGEKDDENDPFDIQFWPSPKAMRILSACYKYGRGTKVDAVKGEYWMAEAAKNKEKNALELMRDE